MRENVADFVGLRKVRDMGWNMERGNEEEETKG